MFRCGLRAGCVARVCDDRGKLGVVELFAGEYFLNRGVPKRFGVAFALKNCSGITMIGDDIDALIP